MWKHNGTNYLSGVKLHSDSGKVNQEVQKQINPLGKIEFTPLKDKYKKVASHKFYGKE